jgi:hypothetical protein
MGWHQGKTKEAVSLPVRAFAGPFFCSIYERFEDIDIYYTQNRRNTKHSTETGKETKEN